VIVRDGKRRSKRKIILIAVAFALGVAAAAAAFTLRDDPEVVDDIDRHFASLGRYEDGPLAHSSTPGGDRAPGGDEPRSSRGRRAAAAGRSARSATGDVRSGSPGGSSQRGQSVDAFGDTREMSSWEGIRRIDPTTYAIDQALAQSARRNPRPFLRHARAAVEKVGEDSIGFRIGGLREDSAIRAVGLENGDVITAVNGHALTSVDEVIAAVASARFSDKFRLDILRGDQALSLYYRVETETP
jgi:hypothetical protein